MPSENTIYLAAIFILFGLMSYLYLKFFDKDDGENKISPDYLTGLKYLLDEKSDKAINLFSSIITVDEETIETHLALGVLYRRQGNIDKAIKLHESILMKEELSENNYFQTLEELGEDYFAAGIYDKSEDIFLKLQKNDSQKLIALKKLIKIYEYTAEWEKALLSLENLITEDPSNELMEMIPHYLCQVADEYLSKDDLSSAKKYIKKARNHEISSLRTHFIQINIDIDNRDLNSGIKNYKILSKHTRINHLILLPDLIKLSKDLKEEDKINKMIDELIKDQPEIKKTLAHLFIIDTDINQETISSAFINYMGEQIYINEILTHSNKFSIADLSDQKFLAGLRSSINTNTINDYKYICKNCGYQTIALSWQCPTCKKWEASKPLNFII